MLDYNVAVNEVTYLRGQSNQKCTSPNPDTSDCTHNGGAQCLGNIIRQDTSTAYLNASIVNQGNQIHPDERGVNGRKLLIQGKSTVDKILFECDCDEDPVAKGVRYVRNGITEIAYARKGVILSAGFFSSVILNRSGIGKPSDLNALGVRTLVANDNVGYNLQTQYFVPFGYEMATSAIFEILTDADPNDTDNAISQGLVNIPGFPNPSRRLQLLGNTFSANLPAQDVLVNNWEFNPTKEFNIASTLLGDLDPKSTGSIVAVHTDPEALPAVNFRRFAPDENGQADLQFIAGAMEFYYRVIVEARNNTPGLIGRVVFPPEEVFEIVDPAERFSQLANYILPNVTNFAHYSGQNRMATSADRGVVDADLNVFGVKKLKVVDLSVAPVIPDGNTSIPAIAIGLNAFRIIQREQRPSC